MRPEPRLIEVRKNVLKQNDVVARAPRDPDAEEKDDGDPEETP